MKRKILSAVLLSAFGMASVVCRAQPAQQIPKRVMTLREALDIARRQSLDALVAKNTMRIAYWQYRDFRADMLPSLTLDGTLPSYNRSLNSYQLDNGSYKFIPSNSISENLALSVTQNIPYTGGSISVQTQLQRIDQLGDQRSTNYMSIPGIITLNQPLITSRPLRWSMKIEPIRYQEAQQQYCVDMERVFIQTINCYFDLLLSTVNESIAEQNLSNATELYSIALGKKKLGLISENDLQQLRLGKLNASASVVTARQDREKKMSAFRNYLVINDKTNIELAVPEEFPDIDITLEEVAELAGRNNPITYSVERRLLESQQLIADARASRGFRADVFASFGFSGTDTRMWPSYKNLQNTQVVSLGLRIPILDWGKGKGKVQLAKSRQDVVKVQVEQETMNFEQNMEISVRQYRDQAELTRIFREADSVARLRYKIAFETFVMGQLSVLDINSAQVEQDNARRNYVTQLYASWLYYYNLRQIALYDFVDRKNIIYDPNE